MSISISMARGRGRGNSRSRSRNSSGAGAGNFNNGRLRQPWFLKYFDLTEMAENVHFVIFTNLYVWNPRVSRPLQWASDTSRSSPYHWYPSPGAAGSLAKPAGEPAAAAPPGAASRRRQPLCWPYILPAQRQPRPAFPSGLAFLRSSSCSLFLSPAHDNYRVV